MVTDETRSYLKLAPKYSSEGDEMTVGHRRNESDLELINVMAEPGIMGGRGCICIILKTLGYISNFSQEQQKK